MNPATDQHNRMKERAGLILRVFSVCAIDDKNVALRRVLNTMSNAEIRQVLERMTNG